MAGFSLYPIVVLERIKTKVEDAHISKMKITPSLQKGKESLASVAVKQEEDLATANIKLEADPSSSQGCWLEMSRFFANKVNEQGGDAFVPVSTFLHSQEANTTPDSKKEVKIEKITIELVSHFLKGESHKEETDLKEVKMQSMIRELVGPCPKYLNKKVFDDKSHLEKFNEPTDEFPKNCLSTSVGIKKENDQSAEDFLNAYKCSSNTTNNNEVVPSLVELEDEFQNNTTDNSERHANAKLIASVSCVEEFCVKGQPMRKSDVHTSLESSNALRCHSRKRLSASERRKKKCRYQCVKCPFKHWNSSTMKSYSTRNHGLYLCPLCSVTFKRQSDLKKHEKAQHQNTDKTPHSCPNCPLKFEQVKYLNFHLKNSCRHLPYENCASEFKSEADPQTHKKSTHPDVRLPTCQKCGEIVTSESKFRSYIKKHILTKSPFLVQTAALNSKIALKRHSSEA